MDERSSGRVWPYLVIAVGVTAVVLWPVLGGYFQADDYNLFGTWLDPVTHAVDAGRLVEEMWPAAATDDPRPFFRPLYALASAVAVLIVGVEPGPLHAINLGLHLLSTCLVALLCAAIVPRSRGFAAGIGGAFFGLHVAGVEPAAWISAMNSALCLPLVLASALCYVRALSGGDRARGVRRSSLAFAAAALLTKEDAWALPFLLIALDLLVAPRPVSLRDLWQRQRAFVALWIGYAMLRMVALDFTVLGRSGASLEARLGEFFANLPYKAWRCIAPWSDALDGTAPAAVIASLGLVAVAILLVCALRRSHRARLAVVALSFVACLGPGFANLVDERWQGARVLYVAVPACALALALGADAVHRARILAPVWITVITAACVAASSRVADWRSAAEVMRNFVAAVVARADQVADEAPLVLLSAPREHAGVPVVLPPFAHLVAQRPWARAEVPVIGASFVLAPYPGAEALGRDAAVLHAMAEAGALLAFGGDTGQPLIEIPAGAAPAPTLRTVDGTIESDAPIPPFAIEALDVTAPAPVAQWNVIVRGAPDEPVGIVTATSDEHGDVRATIDLTHDVRFFALAAVGGLRAIEVHATAADGAALPVSIERIVNRVPLLALGDPPRPTHIPYAPALVAPRAAHPLRLVLIADSHAHAQAVDPNEPVAWSDDTLAWLAARGRASPTGRVFFFFDGGSHDSARSRVASFHVRGRAG